MVSYGAVLCYSETSKIEWVDVNLNQERNAYDVPKCVIITIKALEEDTCKTHECWVEFNFVAVEGTAI
jgi:hypothetical protein